MTTYPSSPSPTSRALLLRKRRREAPAAETARLRVRRRLLRYIVANHRRRTAARDRIRLEFAAGESV